MVDDPKISKEEEYFARQEFERKKKLEEENHGKMADEEKNRLKELHFMRCPKCGMELIEIDHESLKIDKCSSCDGVWLDAGELEEIVKDDNKSFSGFLRIFKK